MPRYHYKKIRGGFSGFTLNTLGLCGAEWILSILYVAGNTTRPALTYVRAHFDDDLSVRQSPDMLTSAQLVLHAVATFCLSYVLIIALVF